MRLYPWLMVVAALAGCEDKKARELQEKTDRAIERVEGKPITSMSQLPPDPPETDVTRGQMADFKGDKATAAKLYKKACDEKVPGGCAFLALMHREGGGGIKKDPALAEKQLKELCDANDGAGCYGLGIVLEYATVTGRKLEPAQVIAVYDKGCTLKSIDACSALGMLHYSGRAGNDKDPEKAADALRRACELGDRTSCLQIDMVKR